MQESVGPRLIALDLNPATLSPSHSVTTSANIRALYGRYYSELADLTKRMAPQRAKILAGGYAADFSNRESEVLYLLVRDLKPEVAVEISPCHGYSTNYILAALQANGRGVLHSYEIMTEVAGKPIERVIRDNLLPQLDQDALILRVGDASQAEVPAADFAFIDSNHEAWFAAWYMDAVVPRVKLCLTHDIVIRDQGVLVPKAFPLGIREACHVLATLEANGQSFAPVAALDVDASREGLTSRHPATERAAIYAGHAQSKLARDMHQGQRRANEVLRAGLLGNRDTAIDGATEIVLSNPSIFARLCAGLVFPLLAYRIDQATANFPKVVERLKADIASPLSVASYNAALELGLRLYSPDMVQQAHRSAARLPADTSERMFSAYRAHSYQFPHLLARGQRKIKSVLG